jgi:RNA polymerase sigma factor (sigma-70 family)
VTDETRDGSGTSALERFAAGDDSAMEELLRQHLPELRAYVRLRVGREIREMESASDIVQSVCREILQHRERFRFPGVDGFRRWLYTTALRKLSKRARTYRAVKRDAAHVPYEEGQDGAAARDLLAGYRSFCTPSRAAQAREEVARIEAAFDQLPDDYREVITMARILGMPHAAIAEQTGRSEGATRMLLYRALERLSEVLERGGA